MENQKHIEAYQELFNYMYDIYGVILIKSEMDDLIKACTKMILNYNDASDSQKPTSETDKALGLFSVMRFYYKLLNK